MLNSCYGVSSRYELKISKATYDTMESASRIVRFQCRARVQWPSTPDCVEQRPPGHQVETRTGRVILSLGRGRGWRFSWMIQSPPSYHASGRLLILSSTSSAIEPLFELKETFDMVYISAYGIVCPYSREDGLMQRDSSVRWTLLCKVKRLASLQRLAFPQNVRAVERVQHTHLRRRWFMPLDTSPHA